MIGEDMRIVSLDAAAWASATDFHDAVLAAFGATAAHIRTSDELASAVVSAAPPFRVEIANLFAAQEPAMDAVYAAFHALTLAGAKTRIDKDGIATITVSAA
jgi:hypothetical protein